MKKRRVGAMPFKADDSMAKGGKAKALPPIASTKVGTISRSHGLGPLHCLSDLQQCSSRTP